MSIASEITRLQGCKSDIRTALVNKGVTSASTHNMADFATDISNISAGGATITVTYDSTFYNKTITCTKGSTTYTKTTTSSGSTTFNVSEEGTWTITCNGVSRTVDVVLEYTTQMAITKTIDIYSAASDTVSFTDVTGAKTVTTDANGHGSVNITFIPPSTNITFTSSVAKNPNDLTAYYSKNVNLTNNTTEVYVMPDGALYWYGYENDIAYCTSDNGWVSFNPTYYAILASSYYSKNTNNITITSNGQSTASVGGISVNSKKTMSKLHAIYKMNGTANHNGINHVSSKTIPNIVGTEYDAKVTNTNLSHIQASVSGSTYPIIAVSCYTFTTCVINALWYE